MLSSVGAVQSELPGCPQYLSKPETLYRESPEEKRQRMECAQVEKAESLSTEEVHNQKISFNNFQELLQ